MKYIARNYTARIPSEHTVDGVRAATESQYHFIIDKKFRNMNVESEIILSILSDNENQSVTMGFFHKMVEKLKTIPVDEMRNTNEENFKEVIIDSPDNLNTYYRRPMSFWAYNGTLTVGDCSKKILRVVLKQKNRNLEEEMVFYQQYLKNLRGTDSNARTVVNNNNVEVHSCGEECRTDLSDVLWFSVVYTVVLYFTSYHI